jgi:hypothetical protein
MVAGLAFSVILQLQGHFLRHNIVFCLHKIFLSRGVESDFEVPGIIKLEVSYPRNLINCDYSSFLLRPFLFHFSLSLLLSPVTNCNI